ncbi:MAG: hypothetical protein IGS39_12700 [Calothrix sp. C42_A2020_038]|nr:hypothetical protein [Calothrix sp. C42_A2020_038]
MNNSIEKMLEQYTIKFPQQVLVITAEINGEQDEITIFKGFSSSLMRGTPFDPDISVLPNDANILNIDIVASPYNPETPCYIEQRISWEVMQARLFNAGIQIT